MIDFSTVKAITIPEGIVTKIVSGASVLWEKITEAIGYTNQVPISTNADGSIFNGCGYQNGYRLSSGGTAKALSGSVVTGYIPCKFGDVVRFKGIKWNNSETIALNSSHYCYVYYYNSSLANAGYTQNISDEFFTKDENGVYTMQKNVSESCAYIRVSGIGDGADLIVTINEEITE